MDSGVTKPTNLAVLDCVQRKILTRDSNEGFAKRAWYPEDRRVF
jgi:hypothetical protein